MTFQWTTIAGSNSAVGVDFTPVQGSFSFQYNDNVAERVINIPLINDRIFKGDRTLQLQISSTNAYLPRTVVTITITDDDPG